MIELVDEMLHVVELPTSIYIYSSDEASQVTMIVMHVLTLSSEASG